MADLKKGAFLNSKNFKSIRVLGELGEGGQGKVYIVEYGDEMKALKWYFSKRLQDPKKFRENLENNIKRGAPTTAF
ncbi:MAG: hypothetical protein LBC09_01140, partial [Helicobacteraceae bacterium]|nr:hypothetical protein [Helicobacteraceae bacterium]